FILFSPVLIWNYLNDFPSFKYRLEAGLVGEASVKNVLNYIFVQLFVLSFPISIYLIFSSFLFLINSIRYKAPFDIFLGVSSIFPFLFFMFTSFFKQADANWPSISQIYMLAVGLKSLKDLKFKNLIYFFSYVWFILVFVLHIHIIYKLFDIKNDRRNELTGWRDFSSFVLELQRKYNAKLYANTYQVASQLTFYTSKIKNEFTLIPALNINSRKNHFEYINYEKPSGVIIYIGSKDNIFGEIIETHNYNHPDGVYEVNVVKLK
ncbi:MAG: hypothetical protein NZ870_04380, partial [bacterium]|nr:hypothetical protein [bacterium]